MSDEIDHEHTDEAVCPHCGHEHGDSWEWFSDGNECAETECHECGKDMLITRHVSISYSTSKPKEAGK